VILPCTSLGKLKRAGLEQLLVAWLSVQSQLVSMGPECAGAAACRVVSVPAGLTCPTCLDPDIAMVAGGDVNAGVGSAICAGCRRLAAPVWQLSNDVGCQMVSVSGLATQRNAPVVLRQVVAPTFAGQMFGSGAGRRIWMRVAPEMSRHFTHAFTVSQARRRRGERPRWPQYLSARRQYHLFDNGPPFWGICQETASKYIYIQSAAARDGSLHVLSTSKERGGCDTSGAGYPGTCWCGLVNCLI
jgi:hypothetical protein